MRSSRSHAVALVVLGALLAAPSLPTQAAGATRWSFPAHTSGNQTQMAQDRYRHTVTALADGRLLAVGGETFQRSSNLGGPKVATVELYDPRSGQWTSCERGRGNAECPEPIKYRRSSHSATRLGSGKVLVTGGDSNAIPTELYDPSTGKWQELPPPVGPNNTGQNLSDHTATLLPDGRVLLVALNGLGFGAPQQAILFNPDSPDNPWTRTRSTTVFERIGNHFAVMLDGPNCGSNCGKILIGGFGSSSQLNNQAAELYDPATETFSPTAAMPLGAPEDDAVLLDNGKVLVAGRNGSQLYDPATGTWTVSSPLSIPRSGEDILEKLPNGNVIAAGGHRTSTVTEMYFPDEKGPGGVPGVWRPIGPLTEARGQSQLAALDCGQGRGHAIVVGGEREDPGSSPRTFSSLPTAEVLTGLPQLTGVEPSIGPLRGGTVVRLRGKDLNSSPGGRVVVRIGSTEATEVTPDPSGTSVSARTPAGLAPGAADVSVTVDGKKPVCSPQDLVFNYLAPPELSGINPPSGLATGGARVTLTGKNFASDSSVRFGSQPAGSVTVSADGNKITAQAPPGDPGPVPVVVTSPGGDTVETTFRYLPAITGIVPDSGPPEGGTTVTIAGKGFSGARSVTFDGIEVVPSQVTDGAVTVKSPPHPPGQVRVGVDVPPHGPAIPVSAGVATFTFGSEVIPPAAGGAGQNTLGGSGSVGPGSETTTTSGGGPATGSTTPPPPGQGQAVPVSSQSLVSSPVSSFEQSPAAMESGSATPVLSPTSVQAPGAAGSHAPGPQPALVSVPEFRPDRAEQYAMVGLSRNAVDPAGLSLSVGVVGLLLCGGLCIGNRRTNPELRARPQEAL